jgi:hypothetical protein
MFEQEHQIAQALQRIEEKVDKLMAAQDDVDAAVTALTSFLSDLSTQVQAIGTILTADGTPVDTTALNNVVAQIPAAQAAVDALASGTSTTGTPTAAGTGTGAGA